MAAGRRAAGSAAKTNVHEVPSSLIGRAADVVKIADRFEQGARIVTVLAPGGMGKTRLAARFAALHLAEYSAHGAGGAWLCDLTLARDVMAVCSAVASALGVPLQVGEDERAVVEALGRAIAHRKRILLVLDNFEQAVSVAGRTVAVWAAQAPHARFLVTSRAILGVAGEELWPLAPLALPEASTDLAALLNVESVDLFVRRARAVRPDFAPTPGDAGALADVVRLADGIPLAIELAAARASILSLAQIRDRMAAPLDALMRRDDGGRHGSMRRAIDDSYVQLGDTERRCFAACAVFRGGFTLEAAERVMGPVLPELDALSARSLLRARASDEQGGGAGMRLSLYETIREYASERLLELGPEAATLAARHCRYFAAFGTSLAAGVAMTGDAAARRRLESDLENLLVAHDRAIEEARLRPSGDGAGLAIALALSLEPVLVPRGLPLLRLRLLDGAIAAARLQEPPIARALAEALLTRGRAHRDAGDFEAARRDLDEGLALARANAFPLLEALAHVRAGELVELKGATGEARRLFDLALERLRAAPVATEARRIEAEARARVGHVHRREGALDAAEAETDRAIKAYRELGHTEGLAIVLYEAAVIAFFRQRYPASRAYFEEGFTLAAAHEARHAEAALRTAFGTMLLEQGDTDLALEQHVRGVQLFREVGNRYREGSALYYLARSYLARRALDEAAKTLALALEIVRAARVTRYEALIEGCRATLLADAGDAAGAAEALAVAARALGPYASEPTLSATLDIHALHVAFAGATVDQRALLLAQARERAGGLECDDPRFALRLLEMRAHPTRSAPREALVIADAGGAVQLPGAKARVDLSRRPHLRRILLALGQRRVDAPGEVLAVDDIVLAGWPGERMRDAAAANRVYVALATLRKLGLRDAIVSAEGGYMLSTALPVVLEPSRT